MSEPTEETRARLESLMAASERLMSAADPAELIDQILESALELFGLEGCTIGLIEDSSVRLSFAAGRNAPKVQEFKVQLGQGIAGWVAQTGEPVTANDVSRDPRFFGGVDEKTGFRTRSILCTPLRRRDRTIGVIEALNTSDPAGFSDDDLRLLTAFGGLAATAIERLRALSTARNASAAYHDTLVDRYRLVTGASPAMQEVLRLARTAAPTSSTVLLLGESGTGKEVVARAVHEWSQRAENPFVAVNCAALSASLLESELFGHEKGAFTGAIAQKKGRFELADGGTIFVDEIADMAAPLQAKMLRVLQEREFQRVGGVKDIRTDVRVIAATNRNLEEAMRKGTFREDLYYRLNVVTLRLPPLRERKEDIPPLVEHFTERYSHEMKRATMTVEPAAMELLAAYPWPGNVRELQNTIERAVVLGSGATIGKDDLPAEVRLGTPGPTRALPAAVEIDQNLPLADAVEALKRLWLEKALARTRGNQTEAARILGTTRSNLSKMMKLMGLR